MPGQDSISVEILPDGTIKFEVAGHVSMPNHASADSFLREAARMAGGETKRTKRIKGLRDISAGFHEHTSDGHTHEHEH